MPPQYLSIVIPLLVVPVVGIVLFVVLHRIVQVFTARRVLAQHRSAEPASRDAETNPSRDGAAVEGPSGVPLDGANESQMNADANAGVDNKDADKTAKEESEDKNAKQSNDETDGGNNGGNVETNNDNNTHNNSNNNNNSNSRPSPAIGDSIITVSTTKAEEQAHETLAFATSLGFSEPQVAAAQDATTKGYAAALSLLLQKTGTDTTADATTADPPMATQQHIDIAKACAGFTFWSWLAHSSQHSPHSTAHVWTSAYAQKMAPELVRMARAEGVVVDEEELCGRIMQAVDGK